MQAKLLLCVLLATLVYTSIATNGPQNFPGIPRFPQFPRGFKFGVSSSAAQYESAANVDGKGQSIWDAFAQVPGRIADGSTPNDALNFYTLYEQDIANMRNLGVDSFRMSISWSRILPNGTVAGGINDKGVQFYTTVFNKLLRAGIEPVVTLYHWDLPQALHTSFGGWLNKEKIVESFAAYADVCFDKFPMVKTWITLNEPWATSLVAYSYGLYAPGVAGDNFYTVTHNQLVAHAAAVTVYRNKYRHLDGKITISLNADHYEPFDTTNTADVQAAERYRLLNFGLFADPIFFGDYPKEMKSLLGARLPSFTSLEKVAIQGSIDFLGFNHYTSRIVGNFNLTEQQCSPGPFRTNNDVQVRYCNGRNGVRLGPPTETEYNNVYPEGFRKVLNWIADRYDNPEIRIYENGADVPDEQTLPKAEALRDDFRREYLQNYIQNVADAVNIDGVNVSEYHVWSLNDGWEWIAGHSGSKYGIHYVDYSQPNRPRTIKRSGVWYKYLISNHKRRHRRH